MSMQKKKTAGRPRKMTNKQKIRARAGQELAHITEASDLQIKRAQRVAGLAMLVAIIAIVACIVSNLAWWLS
jgi:hypothetical protein